MKLDESYVPLQVHTEYSILDSLIHIKGLCQRCVDLNIPAVAMTDVCNLFGLVKFYSTAVQMGLKPIIGTELWYESEGSHPHRVTVLCQDQTGYDNLRKIISRAYQDAPRTDSPIIPLSWFEEYQTGLIVLLGMESDLGQAIQIGDTQKIDNITCFWTRLFDDRCYLAVTRIGRENESVFNQGCLELGRRYKLPIVATNPAVFLEPSDFTAHEARVCIQSGVVLADESRPKHYTAEQHLKSPAQMQKLFSDIPGALTNTLEIAKRCNVEVKLGDVFLPNFPIPQDMTMDAYFEDKAKLGLEHRLKQLNFNDQTLCEPYYDRLAVELQVIQRMGYAGYFLIVADFIQWAKDHAIPVGPGRGSGAGSLVAYALNITDLDPLAYDLLFERFLNPERVSMPDFDIDFCMDNRDRVIDYVSMRYGRESVSQIATFGTMAAKAVVRDVGRVLSHPYGFVDKIAKLIPFEIGMTLNKALEQEVLLKERYDDEEEVKELIDLAKKLEGLVRNVGKHAGGVVIAPSKLTDFSPLYCEFGSTHVVTQFDKDDVEKIGLVKFDFLGLKTLTIIDWAVQAINVFRQSQDEPPIQIEQITLEDIETFQLLKACNTSAVFQLESRGMKDLIARLLPDRFEDIIALVALFRPGPLQSGMVDDFINRKHGRAQVEYPHPDLEPILSPTYGVILYQEQVMQIAQKLAGYTLGGADLLRRAMGKKKPEEMRKQREIFTEGSVERGVDEGVATHIFDLMEKFAGYGFNKSHSAAYALLSYQTAWLKAHYPDYFMAAVLSADMAHTDKVVLMIDDCKKQSIEILSPDINKSHWKFQVHSPNQIMYGLGAIKGVGEGAVESILEEREASGTFKSLHDFIHRIDTKKVNKRVLEALIRSGALDSLKLDRAHLFAAMEEVLQSAEQSHQKAASGQFDLFGEEKSEPDYHQKYAHVPKWTLLEKLKGEKDTLGLYLSGHPVNVYADELNKFNICPIASLTVKDSVKLAGVVVAFRALQTKRGDRMGIITLDDSTAKIDVTVFSDVFNENRDKLVKDTLLVIDGAASVDNFTQGLRVTAKSLYTMGEARAKFAKYLKLKLEMSHATHGCLNEIKTALRAFPYGQFPVKCYIAHEAGEVQLQFGKAWGCMPENKLIETLEEALGEEAVSIEY